MQTLLNQQLLRCCRKWKLISNYQQAEDLIYHDDGIQYYGIDPPPACTYVQRANFLFLLVVEVKPCFFRAKETRQIPFYPFKIFFNSNKLYIVQES